MEGLALLRAWAGDHDYDQVFVTARLAEVRVLLDDPLLTGYPGMTVEPGATPTASTPMTRCPAGGRLP